jgi:predicted GIY-YIG superfamily endonuclease
MDREEFDNALNEILTEREIDSEPGIDSEPDDRRKDWFCYILRNQYEPDIKKTYNGKTNDPVRRLKEHNQVGCRTKGARHTRRYGNSTWEFIAILGYFPTEVEALRHEWRIKKPEGKNRNRRYFGPEGRIKGLNYALGLERFTSNCEKPLRDMDLTIWILREYAYLLEERPELDRLTIIESDRLDDDYISDNIIRID